MAMAFSAARRWRRSGTARLYSAIATIEMLENRVLFSGGLAFTPLVPPQVDHMPAFTSSNRTTFTVGTVGSFTVKTSGGVPTATLSVAGGSDILAELGLTFTPEPNGTAIISGDPTTGGIYDVATLRPITIEATSGTLFTTQNFTLVVNEAPVFAVTNFSETVYVGVPITPIEIDAANVIDGVAATYPLVEPSIHNGSLPGGLHFTNDNEGMGVITGTPSNGSVGFHTFTFQAQNVVGNAAVAETLVLNVVNTNPPVFTSPDHIAFQFGETNSFTFNATSPSGRLPGTVTLVPVNAITLPSGLTFTAENNGKAILAGMPEVAGVFHFEEIDSDGDAAATNSFTLTINAVVKAPTITSANQATFEFNVPGTFTFTTASLSYPIPTLQLSGLPNDIGLTFTDEGNGTGMLTGMPNSISEGTFMLMLTATNIAGSKTQEFKLTIGV
jgi:large repetitive protein